MKKYELELLNFNFFLHFNMKKSSMEKNKNFDLAFFTNRPSR
jgi:hypothetical protein